MAGACTCFGGLLFDDNVKQSRFVLLGRVKAQGRQELPTSTRPEIVYLDVEVLEVPAAHRPSVGRLTEDLLTGGGK